MKGTGRRILQSHSLTGSLTCKDHSILQEKPTWSQRRCCNSTWTHQFSSVTQSCLTLCNPMNCSTPGLPVHHQLSELVQTHAQWVWDAIQPFYHLSSPSPPAFNLSQHQGLFQWVSSSHQVAKVLEFQLHHQSFKWYSGLISFRVDWLDLLAVQGTLKSLLQHHSSKASVLQCSASFMVHISHPYMITGKTKALTKWTFVGKVMFLLFNMLSRLVITFLPRSKHEQIEQISQWTTTTKKKISMLKKMSKHLFAQNLLKN